MRAAAHLVKVSLVLLPLIASAGALLSAGPEDTAPVDAILDRLEKRLLDQEADGLTFSEKTDANYIVKPAGKITKYKFSGDKDKPIEAAPSEQEKLKSVALLVTELENQVDHLASSVQKTKQSILDEAAIDNFVTLEAQLAETDTAAIKTLSVKLDGYSVYELSEASGLWMPSKSVPLFAGPLQPGSHRLDLEVRLVVRHKQTLPMNSDIYRFVNKTFDLNIGGHGPASSARWVIAITPPDKLDGAADATLKQAL